jgi:hypothetical protein
MDGAPQRLARLRTFVLAGVAGGGWRGAYTTAEGGQVLLVLGRFSSLETTAPAQFVLTWNSNWHSSFCTDRQ